MRLLASRESQRCLEPVAEQRVDAGDVSRREPAGEADRGPELIEGRAASSAASQMAIDSALLCLVRRTVKVSGKAFDKVDAAQIPFGG